MLGSRKKPAPFKRPSISLADPDERREWQTVRGDEVEAGDMVADWGLVTRVDLMGFETQITFLSENVMVIGNSTVLRVFAKVRA